MNPLTNVKNITKLNEIELAKGLVDKKSWHDVYKDSAWIFIGGLAYGLTEGDILAVFSQYGEIVNLNLVRDKKTGKTKGFCFLCYANQKSTILAVDNLNGIKLIGRTIRVDHVSNYKPPKDNEHDDELTKQLKSEGCAPRPIKLETSPVQTEIRPEKKRKKVKKEKKKHKKSKRQGEDENSHKKVKVKKEKHDPGYDKYENPQNGQGQTSGTKHKKVRQRESSNDESSSDDTSAHHADSLKKNKVLISDKKSQSNYDEPGISGAYKSSKDKWEKRDSRKKQRPKDTESDSSDQYTETNKLKLERTKKNKHSDFSYNKNRSVHQPSSSEDSSARDSKSMPSKRKTEDNHKTYDQSYSFASSHNSKYHSDINRKKSKHHRHDSSDSDVSPSRTSYKEKKDSTKDPSRFEDSYQDKNSYQGGSEKYRDSLDNESKISSKSYSRSRRSYSKEKDKRYSKSSTREEYRRHKNERRDR